VVRASKLKPLEYKSDHLVSDQRQGFLAVLGNVDPFEQVSPRAGARQIQFSLDFEF